MIMHAEVKFIEWNEENNKMKCKQQKWTEKKHISKHILHLCKCVHEILELLNLRFIGLKCYAFQPIMTPKCIWKPLYIIYGRSKAVAMGAEFGCGHFCCLTLSYRLLTMGQAEYTWRQLFKMN